MTKQYTPAQEVFLLDCAIRFKAEAFNRQEHFSRNFTEKDFIYNAKTLLKAAQEEGLLQDECKCERLKFIEGWGDRADYKCLDCDKEINGKKEEFNKFIQYD